MAQIGFDASTVKADDAAGGGGRVYPDGWYPMVITDTELKANKTGSGMHLEIRHQILDGPDKGGKFVDWLTLTDPEKPAEAAKGQGRLSSLCAALGMRGVGDSSELHNKAYMVELEFSKGTGAYKDRNFVKSRKPMGGATYGTGPALAPAGSFAPAPAPAAAAAQPPYGQPAAGGFAPAAAAAPAASTPAGTPPAWAR